MEMAGSKGGNTNSAIVTKVSYEEGKGTVIKHSLMTDKEKLEKQKLELEVQELLNTPSIISNIDRAVGEIPKSTGTVIPSRQPLTGAVSGGMVIPKYSGGGRAKEIVDIGAETAIKRAEAEVGVEKEVASQKGKAGELAERDFLRASAAVDTAFDQVLAFDEEQFTKYGVKPGDYLGLFAKLTPSQKNQFKAAAVGAGRESAALIARQIIPGVRAANITKIFAKSSAEIGNTQEGNAANVSASMGNAFANAISANIDVVTENGKKVRIQDVTIDPKTGKTLSQLPYEEKSRAINDIKRKFAEDSRQDYINRVYKRNPSLLKPETVARIKAIEGAGLDPNEWEVL
jgi:hypothetical protein